MVARTMLDAGSYGGAAMVGAAGEYVSGGGSRPPRLRPRVPQIEDDVVRTLVDEMNRAGLACLPSFLDPADLRDLQAFVRAAVEAAGGEYVVFTGKEAVGGTVLETLAESEAFNGLIRRVYEQGMRRPAPDQGLHQVLRCLAGETGQKEAYIFHYDSFAVTLLLPVLIPTGPQRGDLVLAPNLRTVRPHYALNLVDKLLIDNKLAQVVLKRLLVSQWGPFQRVNMVPGDLYFFWGYRTLHTNEACDAGEIRSTALFHFGDPHAGSFLRRSLGRVAV
jgi:hypothetical protein